MSWFHKAFAWAGLTEPAAGPPPRYLGRSDAELYGEDRLSFRKPRAYDEVAEVGDLLKEEQPVVLNLEDTGLEDRRRIVDFLYGVTHAIDGEVCRVAEDVFIFSPNRIAIDRPDAEVARGAFGTASASRGPSLRQHVSSM